MKKGFLFMAIAALAFTSCDKIPEIKNFAVDNKFETEFTLDIKANDPLAFESDYTVDMKDNADFKENLAQIDGYTVKSLSYKIGSFTGEESISANANVQFFNGTDQIGSDITLDNIAFKALLDSETEVDIPVSDEMKRMIQDNLLNNSSITIKFGGDVSDAPILSKIIFGLELEALVKVSE
jgi:hypothetical protein